MAGATWQVGWGRNCIALMARPSPASDMCKRQPYVTDPMNQQPMTALMPIMHHRAPNPAQRGAVIVTVALFLIFLLGFMAIALDIGHLFIVRTELQTAVDSCALAAAQELDGESTAITRATNAGMAAGNLNGVNFQSANWSGQGQLTSADITFMDAGYQLTTAPANARYAQCQHTQPNIPMWLLQFMGAFTGNTTAYASQLPVTALAVATLGGAQSVCPVPLGIQPKTGGTPPNYGYQVGEWVTLVGSRVPGSGEIGWYNLDGSTSASETVKELSEGGHCGTKVGDSLGTPGVQTVVDTIWNYRFGIYKNGDPGPSVNHPDLSGYAYTATNWKNPVPQHAWSGTPAAGSDPTAANFQAKRAAFASFDDTGTSLQAGSLIVFGSKNALNSFKTLATPGSGGQHQQYGYNRRLVTVPVINTNAQVQDFLCMFMLSPLTGPSGNTQLEFLGNSSNPAVPCHPNGVPGSVNGPLVPVLVQ